MFAHQISTDGAADAAVHHLDHLFFAISRLENDGIVDTDLSEFVLDDGKFHAMHRSKDVVQKRRLSRAKEAGEDLSRAWIQQLIQLKRRETWFV